MQVVILAGGLGTRLAEETVLKPKPMVEIGGKPILWHIMKYFSSYGHKDFVICLGYKGYYIKEWFANYFLHNSDITIHTKDNKISIHNTHSEDWTVTLVDTGDSTMTGGRIKRIIDAGYIHEDEFFMTYGDGLSDVNLDSLAAFHTSHSKLATLTAVQPENRFGKLTLNGTLIEDFGEKQDNVDQFINGGFMILNKKIADYITDDTVPFEKYPLETLAHEGNLMAYKHSGFWFAMDTLNHKQQLEKMWDSLSAPWKKW